jgi:hypothetical protein
MARAHEKFIGARILTTFAVAVITQSIVYLLVIRLGLLGFFLNALLFFAFIAIFGGAFLIALRRLSTLRSRPLRFAVPMLCTIVLLFCSYVAGGYLGERLNTAVFHMPVEDFDK